jgi:4'-phosphopantetheinyl transferase
MTEGVVHCFGANLSDCELEEWVSAAQVVTSPAERLGARRFVHRADAARHLVGRAILRRLLTRWHPQAPADVVFTTNEFGKPNLPDSRCEFSISHSGDWVWVAVALDVPVGIDVEQRRPGVDLSFIIPHLHPAEQESLAGGDSAMALRCWTRKEAVVKALGMGLSMPLNRFVVAVDERRSGWLLSGPVYRDGAWTCVDLPVSHPYHLSLAAAAPELRIHVDRVMPDHLRGVVTRSTDY